MMNNEEWMNDRNKRAKELDRLEKELMALYESALVGECPDAKNQQANYEAICQKLDTSKYFQCRSIELPFSLNAEISPKALSLLLAAGILRVISVKAKGKKHYLSLDEVYTALADVLQWEPCFLELSRERFSEKWSIKPALTKAIAAQIRRDLTGFIGEFMEHCHNCKDFEDFFKAYRAGLVRGKDYFDFNYKRAKADTEVKTGTIEGKYYIFSNSTLRGEPKVVLMGLVRFEEGGAIWEGGLISGSDILKNNPTIELFKIDESGNSSTILRLGLRPEPELMQQEPFCHYKGYYGIQAEKQKRGKSGRNG